MSCSALGNKSLFQNAKKNSVNVRHNALHRFLLSFFSNYGRGNSPLPTLYPRLPQSTANLPLAELWLRRWICITAVFNIRICKSCADTTRRHWTHFDNRIETSVHLNSAKCDLPAWTTALSLIDERILTSVVTPWAVNSTESASTITRDSTMICIDVQYTQTDIIITTLFTWGKPQPHLRWTSSLTICFIAYTNSAAYMLILYNSPNLSVFYNKSSFPPCKWYFNSINFNIVRIILLNFYFYSCFYLMFRNHGRQHVLSFRGQQFSGYCRPPTATIYLFSLRKLVSQLRCGCLAVSELSVK